MKSETRRLVEISVLIALAVALDLSAQLYSGFFWIFGGSVSISLVPIAILSYRHGWKYGVFGGFAMGIIQLLLGATIYHPIQVLFDYPLPYACLGITGLWATQVHCSAQGQQSHYIWLSTMIGSFARLVIHTFSGVIFFADYAPEGMSPLLYSIAYNFPYIAMSWILSAALLVVLYRRHYQGFLKAE